MLGNKRSEVLLANIRNGQPMSQREKLRLIVNLSIPSILAQITTVMMFFIDAGMVGHLGAEASASIGLVESTTWLMGSVMTAASTGFSVQVAHFIGANDFFRARQVFRHALICGLLFSMLIAVIGIAIHNPLPLWLGGGSDIAGDSSRYFLVFSMTMPFILLFHLSNAMIKCSGNMQLPSVMSVLLCILDVIFNYVFIYLLHMGVVGAAIGTSMAYICTSLPTVWLATCRNKILALKLDTVPFHWVWNYVTKAIRISLPMAVQSVLMSFQLFCNHGREPMLYAGIRYRRCCDDARWPDIWCRKKGTLQEFCPHDRSLGHDCHGFHGLGDVYICTRNDWSSESGRSYPQPWHYCFAHRSLCRTVLCCVNRGLQHMCRSWRHTASGHYKPCFHVVRPTYACSLACPRLWTERRLDSHGNRTDFPWKYVSLPPFPWQLVERNTRKSCGRG